MSIEIHYCVKCQWMLRSSWLQQELLSTFTKEQGVLRSVALVPSWEAGTFVITVNGDTVWDRKVDGGFPQAKELKQRVRDRLEPGKDLGHNDSHAIIPQPVPQPSDSNESGNFGSPKLNAKQHTFCEECVEQLPPTWEL